MTNSNDTILFEGEAVTLGCTGYSQFDLEIVWSHNGETLMNSSLFVNIYEQDFSLGERQFKLSLLELCDVMVADSGSYTCVASNGKDSANATTQLTVLGK